MRTFAQHRDFQPTVYGEVPNVHANRQAAFPEEPEAANANRLQQRKFVLERDIATFGERSRNAELVRAAYRNGAEEGQRSGYISGMHWGLLRGAIAGALLTSLLVWLAILSSR